MLKFIEEEMLSDSLGDNNPVADINNVKYIHAGYKMSPEAQKRRPPDFGEGMISTMLPYMQQDEYDRTLKKKKIRFAVLENEFLRAKIMIDYGARLWSLYSKTEERELLYVNPVLRFANLSLRNAWFSGGVEWNVSIKGHNPLTCSPMFVEKLDVKGGSALRVYDYERIRGVSYKIDFILLDDSDMLIVNPKIENTENKEKYNYWWSNIAVPETDKTRIIVPAKGSFLSSYGKGGYFVDYVAIPKYEGRDVTYPHNAVNSNDFFYDIESDEDKWIAAVDGDGKGLLQLSPKEMIGRKLFVWGRGRGGRNWGNFLTSDGSRYVEIQAGLAKTQLQHIKIKPESSIEWVEAYTAVNIDKTQAHGDYSVAINAVKEFLSKKFGKTAGEYLRRIKNRYSNAKTEIYSFGSGWGYLRNYENAVLGLPNVSDDCDYPKISLGYEQTPYAQLIENGYVAEIPVTSRPHGYIASRYFRDLIERSLTVDVGRNWYAYYLLGVSDYALGDAKKAEESWERSVEIKENGWALRNLAMLYNNVYSNGDRACESIKRAVEVTPDRSLFKDCGELLAKNGKYAEWLDICERMPKDIAKIGRMRYLKAYCLCGLEKYGDAAQIIDNEFVMPDMQEGELSVSELWYEIYGNLNVDNFKNLSDDEKEVAVDKVKPIDKLDFRMHRERR